MYPFTIMTGLERISEKIKRGFPTKRDALEWKRNLRVKKIAKLNKQIEDVKRQVDNMHWRLHFIVHEFKYQNIEEFMDHYRKTSEDMDTYEQALEGWDRVYVEKGKGNKEVQINNDLQEKIMGEHYDDYKIKWAREENV